MSEPDEAAREREAFDLLLRGFQVSRMLRLAADLGIADRIAPDGRTAVEELARNCGVQPLRTDTSNSLHHAARFWTAPGSWRAWERLDVALTGGVPHEAAWSMGRFEYLRAHLEEARLYDAMMAHSPDNRHTAIATAYDFSGVRLIVDIGGGNGVLLRQILARFPTPRGLMFDLEDVVRAIPPDGLIEGRITAAAGSFFEGVPAGADLYLAGLGPARLPRRGLPAHPTPLPRGDGAGGAAADRRAAPRPRPGARPADRLPARHAHDGDVRQRARADGGGVPRPAGRGRLRAAACHPVGSSPLSLLEAVAA